MRDLLIGWMMTYLRQLHYIPIWLRSNHFATDRNAFVTLLSNAPRFAYRLFQSKSHACESRERVLFSASISFDIMRIRVNIEA